MLLLVDDVSALTAVNLHYLCDIKNKYDDIYIILFVIVNHYDNMITKSDKFIEFINGHSRWVTVGSHGYDHAQPPEQEREDAGSLVRRSYEELEAWLPAEPLYRPPGFQRTIDTERIVKEAGFDGIAYQHRIKYFSGAYITNFINCHLTIDSGVNPINRWKSWMK